MLHLGREMFRGPTDEPRAALMAGTATGDPAKMTVPAEFDLVARLPSRYRQRPLPAGRIMAGIWRQPGGRPGSRGGQMSMPAPDLCRSFHVIRRYGTLVGIAAAVSLLAGIATAAVSPATVTSTALVVLPQAGQDAAAAGEPAPFTATQEEIAGSNPVLASALPDVRPAMSLSGLRHDIQIGSPAPDVISVSARGDTAGDAEATASAVARSYLRYVGSARSPAGRGPAHLLEPAASVTGTARLLLLLAGAGLGAVSGVLTGFIAAVVSRRLTS